MHGPDTGMAPLPPCAVMSHEIAGEVIDVCRGTGAFRVGDRVTVMPRIACGRCAACLSEYGYRCTKVRHSALRQERGAFAGYMRIV